jgi:hypothetical protein
MRTKVMIAKLCACLLVFPISAFGNDLAAKEGPEAGKNTAARKEPATESEGQILVRRAREILQRYFAVSAHVTQSVRLFGQEVIGSGSYFEQRSNQGLQYRLELNVQTKVDEQPSSLLEVCDGRFLWNYRKLQGAETLSRLDLAQLQQKIEEGRDYSPVESHGPMAGFGGIARAAPLVRPGVRL